MKDRPVVDWYPDLDSTVNRILGFAGFVANDMHGSITIFGH
jgi:hypothetical protein